LQDLVNAKYLACNIPAKLQATMQRLQSSSDLSLK